MGGTGMKFQLFCGSGAPTAGDAPSHWSLLLRLSLLVQSWERGDPLRPLRRHARLSWQVQYGFFVCFVVVLEDGEEVEGKERSLLNVQKLKANLHVHIFISFKISERNT